MQPSLRDVSSFVVVTVGIPTIVCSNYIRVAVAGWDLAARLALPSCRAVILEAPGTALESSPLAPSCNPSQVARSRCDRQFPSSLRVFAVGWESEFPPLSFLPFFLCVPGCAWPSGPRAWALSSTNRPAGSASESEWEPAPTARVPTWPLNS